MTNGTKRAWYGGTYGNRWMHNTLTSMLRVLDTRILYAFSAFFVVPVTLFRPGAKFLFRYFVERMHYNRIKALWSTYINHCLFGQVIIDRFAMYAGKKFKVNLHGYEHFENLSKHPDGFVQLSAHVGNYELAGYTLVAKDKPMNALVFGGEKATVMQQRSHMFGSSHISMIPICDDMSHLFAINNALANGEIVSMPADRTFGSDKSVEVEFLGAPTHLPAGPFRVAVMRGCNVLAVNVMKSSSLTYDIHITPLDYDRTKSRSSQVQELAEAYIKQLETTLKSYPTQWYNYFDFWKQ